MWDETMRGASERDRARAILGSLRYLMQAVDRGGQVSFFHLEALHRDVAALLEELGGFEEVLSESR